MHENKILYNLWLLSFGRPKRLAFWGHGRNMQSDKPNGFKEGFKRWTINKVDWWFAYTKTSADLVREAGFPVQKTTVVENAVDTESLTNLCRLISPEDIQKKRQELQLDGGQIGLYLGSLYKEKRIDFLIDAAIKIRQKIPLFQLLIAGAGPEQDLVEAAAKTYSWIYYVGPVKEHDKAMVLALADVILNPGLVGLGVLDSFASGKPMLTTDCGLHSPEISYLISGVNGLITVNDINIFSDTAIHLLNDSAMLSDLSRGALSSASNYTITNMVSRIHTGIVACLNS
jgi:glycosyltransferase involved in cell wall biosynthesis